MKGPDAGLALAACRVTLASYFRDTQGCPAFARHKQGAGCVAVGLDSPHPRGQHPGMTKSVYVPPHPRRDGRLSLCVTDQPAASLLPESGVALVRVLPYGGQVCDETPPGWAGVWTWHAPLQTDFAPPAAATSAAVGALATGRRRDAGRALSRGLVAESLPPQAGGVQGSALAANPPGCACCVGVGGLDRFLLARAQEHVRGTGPAFHALVVLCPAGMAEPVRGLVQGSGLLAAFYSLEPAPV